MAAMYSTVTMYHTLFNYSPIDRYSSYFQPFAAMNISVQTSLHRCVNVSAG